MRTLKFSLLFATGRYLDRVRLEGEGGRAQPQAGFVPAYPRPAGNYTRFFGNEADMQRKFRLGIVTYMIAAQWDLPTMLKVCKNVGLCMDVIDQVTALAATSARLIMAVWSGMRWWHSGWCCCL